MHLFSFKDKAWVSDDVSQGGQMIHWLPVSDENVEVEVLMDDNKISKGLGEADLKNVKVGDIIQFERFGFCRLDSNTDGTFNFWFAHK